MRLAQPSRAHFTIGFLLIGAMALSLWIFKAKTTTKELFCAQTGYRAAEFRSATPSSIDGGKVISLEELEALIAKDKPILIDVISYEDGLFHWVKNGGKAAAPRKNISGSHWMPMLGRAELAKPVEIAQINAIKTLTNNDMARPIVIYCQADCWTSWNAARRSIQAGFTRVHWFREGTDLWNDAGLPLQIGKLP